MSSEEQGYTRRKKKILDSDESASEEESSESESSSSESSDSEAERARKKKDQEKRRKREEKEKERKQAKKKKKEESESEEYEDEDEEDDEDEDDEGSEEDEDEEEEQEEEESKQQVISELDYNILAKEDSDSRDTFSEIKIRIKKRYPTFRDEWEVKPVQKKVHRDHKPSNNNRAKSSGRKQQHKPKKQTSLVSAPVKMDAKTYLVYEFAKRWRYALPEWPPKDYDYEGELRKLGYRVVSQEAFKRETEMKNGLAKAYPIEAYRGMYKASNKIIDVRPQESCPSIANFKKMSMSELTQLLINALGQQLLQLSSVKIKQPGEDELASELKTLLNKYSR